MIKEIKILMIVCDICGKNKTYLEHEGKPKKWQEKQVPSREVPGAYSKIDVCPKCAKEK